MLTESLGFGQRLKRWRQRAGLTQEKARAVLGIGRSYYSRLECGRKKPGRFLLDKFALIEHAPVALEHAPAVREEPVTEREAVIARLIEKVLRIEREGSADQLEMLDAAIDSQLRIARRRRECGPSQANLTVWFFFGLVFQQLGFCC